MRHARNRHFPATHAVTTLLACGMTLLAAAQVMAATAKTDAEDPLQAFRQPSATAKPGVWWHWMGCNVSKQGITRDLEAFQAAGISAATIFGMADVCTPWAGNIPNSPNDGLLAFTDPWWQLVRHAAAEGKRLGLDIGVHNCPGYTASGGPWITPELSMQEVCTSLIMVDGGVRFTGTVPRPQVDPRAVMAFPVINKETGLTEKPVLEGRKTFYRDIALLAMPADGVVAKEQVVNLTGKMDSEGRLDWSPPAGKWVIYRIGHTTLGSMTQPNQWEVRGLECDKMSAKATEFHIQHVLAAMRRNLGDLVGTGLQHVLFDSYEAGTPSWTPKMAEEFAARRNYDLTLYLATFAGRVIGSAQETKRFQRDFSRTIADLYRDCYFATVSRLLKAANLRFVCEPYGGPWWQCEEVTPYVDRVMTEFWNGPSYQGSGTGGMMQASGGKLHNILEAEAFTGPPEKSQWTESPAGLKPAGDGAFCAGINRLVFHSATHQPWDDRYRPGNSMGQWGTHIGRLQTWWEPGKAWIAYLQRCQALLQWGAAAPEEFSVVSGLAVHGIHRHAGNADLFFVSNPTSNKGVARCVFPVAKRQPELWDPATGATRDLMDYEGGVGGVSLPLEFAPAQSYFIVFRRNVGEMPATDRANFPSLEPLLELTGAWQVSFDPQWGGPDNPVTFDKLVDWTQRAEPGIKYFSGTAVYRKAFDAPPTEARNSKSQITNLKSEVSNLNSPLQFDLGPVRHLARVRLNGRDLGVVWCAPWSATIPVGLLKDKDNMLEIEVTNVWANRLIGDEQEPPDCDWRPTDKGGACLKQFPDWFVKNQPRPSKGRFCFTPWNYFTRTSPLVASGLLGPVRVMQEDWRRKSP